ncbi:MAG: hypothetical protein ACE15E_05745 [Acidobacteriota bacterium]
MALKPVAPAQPAERIAARILVACALRRETDSVRAVLPGSLDFVTTGIGNRQAGKVLARRLPHLRPSVLVFTGTAGQLDPSCPMGTVVCPETWMIEERGSTRVSEQLLGPLRARGWEIKGSGLTLSLPVLRSASRLELFQRTGAPICDMEAGVALQVAESLGIPALAAKVVSDTGDCTFIDFYRNLNRNLQALGVYLQRLVKDLEEIITGERDLSRCEGSSRTT